MAKTGLDYFKTDTSKFQDIKIKRLKKEFKGTGISVWDYILTEIYRVKGSFIQWDESTVFDVAEYFGEKETLIKEIVNYCCHVGLFDKELLASERVLTSKAIQSRYIEMCKKARRVDISIPENINLIHEETINMYEESTKMYEEPPKLHEEIDKGKKRKVNIYLIDSDKPIDLSHAKFFYIAKSFHKFFLEVKGNIKSLANADYQKWVDTVRLLIESDKVPDIQLVAIKLYLEDAHKKVKGTDPFWIETIYSLNALRKKNKDDVYYFDMIGQQVKKWLELSNNDSRVRQAHQRLEKLCNGN